MRNMNHFVGEEVFVIVPEEDTISEIKIYDNFEETTMCLLEIDPLAYPETKVFHGILTRAETIPSGIKNKNCYIIAVDAYYDSNNSRGILYESDCEGNTNDLANDVELAIESSLREANGTFFYEIEHIYILYGYEVTTGLCINRESLDEEIVHTCKTIAVEAIRLSKEHIKN